MERRFHRGFTAAEKTELWDRWKRGESLKADGYLSLQMVNHRLPKERTWFGRRKFSFQTDPADFTEIGKAYRRRSIRVELALLAWVPIIPITLSIISGK